MQAIMQILKQMWTNLVIGSIRIAFTKRKHLFTIFFLLCVFSLNLLLWQLLTMPGNINHYRLPVIKSHYQQLFRKSNTVSFSNKYLEKFFSWPSITYPLSYSNITNSTMTTISIVKYDKSKPLILQPGDVLQLKITARDKYGIQKRYGGDFFRVALMDHSRKTVIHGKITDNWDGTYTVELPIYDFGKTQKLDVEVTLVHPSESIELVRRMTDTGMTPNHAFYGMFQSGRNSQETQCVGVLNQQVNSQTVCDFSDRIFGPWYCHMPNELECRHFAGYRVANNDAVCVILKQSNFFQPGVTLNVRAKVKQTINFESFPNLPFVYVYPGLRKKLLDLPNCSLEVLLKGTGMPNVFYNGGKWQPLQCVARNLAPNTCTKSKCFKDKQIYFVGDSHAERWYDYFVSGAPLLPWTCGLRAIESPEKKQQQHTRKSANDFVNNTTLHYIPFVRPKDIGKVSSILPTFNAIANAKESAIVVMSIGSDVIFYNPGLFMEELDNFVLATRHMLTASPEIPTFYVNAVNGDISEDDTPMQKCLGSNEWLLHRFNSIATTVWKDVDGVAVINSRERYASTRPTADFTLEEMNMFMSAVCPSYVTE